MTTKLIVAGVALFVFGPWVAALLDLWVFMFTGHFSGIFLPLDESRGILAFFWPVTALAFVALIVFVLSL